MTSGTTTIVVLVRASAGGCTSSGLAPKSTVSSASNACASLWSSLSVGFACPLSMREMSACFVPTRSASSACDQPRSSRSASTLFAGSR